MNDLRESLRRAMEAFEPNEPPIDAVRSRMESRRRLRRIGSAAVGLAIFASGFGVLNVTFRHGGAHPPVHYADHPFTLTAVQPRTGVECRADLAHSVVSPAETTAFTFRLVAGRKGMSTRGVGSGYLVVQDRDGNLVSGSESGANEIVDNLNMLGMASGEYPPGYTVPLTALNVPVQWAGPLTVRPGCVYDGGVIWVPPVQIQVMPTTPPRSAEVALEGALAATGGLFDRCQPTADGSPVIGVIDPPVARDGASEFRARCWARVEQLAAFDVVTLSMVSPPDAAAFELPPQMDSTQLPQLPGGGPIEASRWRFLVTREDVRAIEPLESTQGGRFQNTVDYVLKGGSWTVTTSCGGQKEGISFFLPVPPEYASETYIPCIGESQLIHPRRVPSRTP